MLILSPGLFMVHSMAKSYSGVPKVCVQAEFEATRNYNTINKNTHISTKKARKNQVFILFERYFNVN